MYHICFGSGSWRYRGNDFAYTIDDSFDKVDKFTLYLSNRRGMYVISIILLFCYDMQI